MSCQAVPEQVWGHRDIWRDPCQPLVLGGTQQKVVGKAIWLFLGNSLCYAKAFLGEQPNLALLLMEGSVPTCP